jgi:hypothetical protein
MSVVSVECCQVEVSTLGLSFVQRITTERGVSESDCEASVMRRLLYREK